MGCNDYCLLGVLQSCVAGEVGRQTEGVQALIIQSLVQVVVLASPAEIAG